MTNITKSAHTPARRFVIEGEWIGYRSHQDRVVHRQVYKGAFKKLRAWAEKTHCIRYSDGTSLVLSVRDCKPGERVKEIRGYTRLIDDCAHFDVASVEALQAAERAAKCLKVAVRESGEAK